MGTNHLMSVAFLNENTLGHGSYLPRFIKELELRPELGIRPCRLDATPMPPAIQKRADFSIRGLRRVGIDFHVARWRRVVSRHAHGLIEEFRKRQPLDAIVINTQSVGLELTSLGEELPLLVCLDATFAQLRRSRWFAMNRVAGWLTPLTLAPILPRERRLLKAARQLLPWSAPVKESLLKDYAISPSRIRVLPPSLDLTRMRPRQRVVNKQPRVLFVGGDFFRKGGPVLREAHQRFLADRCDLHLITESAVPEQPGLHVHRNVKAGTDLWFELWQNADVFVFPSLLETFGIVLLEALAFRVPVVASRAGAAVDILDGGKNGLLLDQVTPEAIAEGVIRVLTDPLGSGKRAEQGRLRVERDFNLPRNTECLAEMIRDAVARNRSKPSN